jgi:2-dehydro-3-deoxy-D-arabinonate dehydratase
MAAARLTPLGSGDRLAYHRRPVAYSAGYPDCRRWRKIAVPLCLFRSDSASETRLGLIDAERVVDLGSAGGPATLVDLLTSSLAEVRARLDAARANARDTLPLDAVQLVAPIDRQEVWAAGVTYLRSRDARMAESTQRDVYDRVYDAERPELFLKATPNRVVGPGQPVAIRGDSTWDVPEPELALVLNRDGETVGYTIGNDMSSRSIEGENPLYLPQAKMYQACAALGPSIALAWEIDNPLALSIALTIRRGGEEPGSCRRRSSPWRTVTRSRSPSISSASCATRSSA